MKSIRKSRITLTVFAAAAILATVVAIPIAVGSGSSEDESHTNPQPIGAKVEIASGASGGIGWALALYRSDRGFCFEQQYSGAATSVSATCGALAPGKAVSAVIDRFGPGGGASGQFVYGPVRPGVAGVEVVLDSGVTIAARPVAAPASIGTRDRFYVAVAPAGAEVAAVRAKDRGGKVVDAYAPTPAPTGREAVPSHS